MSEDSYDMNFLSDDPIASDEEDAFQHTEYVDALERILTSVEEPWHIGIFGKWGSGKTSIIRLLFNRITERDIGRETVCIEFDAWKHAENSIRTELLLTLDRELGNHADKNGGLMGEDDITGQLYDVDEEQRAETDNLLEGIHHFIQHSTHLIAIVVVLGFAAIGTSLMGFNGVSTSLLVLIAVPLLVFMAEQLQTATTTLQRKFVYPRKEWSGAYERIFQQLIEQAQQETETERIIISIDNLDRCQSQTVYEVLVSLKTFMDVPPCIYIIPCDDDALRSHIQQIDHNQGTYFQKSQNTREFLRKFFQTTIRIPPMLADDIEAYAEKQNTQLNQQYVPEVLDVLTKAYIKTPRRIKQGLNRVTALYMLAEEIEESDAGLETGRVTDHSAFLAKIAVLEEDYPKFYNALQDDPRLLDDVDRFFTGDLPADHEDRVERLFEETAAETSGVSNLRSFLKATRPTSVPDIKPFLYLSEPHYSGALDPGFVQLLRTNQIQEVERILDNVDEEAADPFALHCDAIENIVNEYDQEGRNQALFSTIESILEIFDRFNNSAKQRVADAVGDVLAVRISQDFVGRLDPKDLVWLLDRLSDETIRTNLFNTIAQTVVADGEWQKNRLEALVWHAHEYNHRNNDRAINPLPNTAKQTISDQLLQLPTGDSSEEFSDSELGEALEFIYSYSAASSVMTARLFEPLLSAIERKDEQTAFQNANLYVKLDEGASPTTRGQFVSRLLENAPANNENRADRSYSTLADHLLEIQARLNMQSANELYTYLDKIVTSKNTKAIDIVEAGFHFYGSASDETQKQFLSTIVSLIENWGHGHARKPLEWAIKYENETVFENTDIFTSYLSYIPEKFSNSTNIREVVSHFAPHFEPELNEEMERLIESRDADERRLGADIFSGIPNRFSKTRGTVVDTCLQKSRQAETDERQSYLTAVGTVFHEIKESDQQTFIDRMEDFLDSRASKDYQAFKQVWEGIEGEVKPRFQRQLADSIIEVLEDVTQPPRELVTVFYDIHKELSEGKLQRCIEIMVNRIGDANASQSRSIFNLLADCPDFEGSEDAVLTRIESFLTQNTTNRSTSDIIDEVLAAVEKYGKPDKDRIVAIRKNHL